MSNIFLKIDELTQGVSLKAHYAALSHRYRTQQDKALANNEENLAYLACRMPATFAVCCEVFKRLKEIAPTFTPQSMLDVGSGPATCVLALLEHYAVPEILTMVEPDHAFVGYAKQFLEENLKKCAWQSKLPDSGTFDLVTSSYMLSELDIDTQDEMLETMVSRAASTIALVDTGTPHGYTRLIRARDYLIQQNFTILAPCPHNKPCPIVGPDWCHFSVRLARSRLHRQLKNAELGYEDEKFCYIIASRDLQREREYERILAHPLKRTGHMHIKLCMPDGSLCNTIVSKKTKERYQLAKKSDWGDAL
jgi:ribosomal protein RSM22 (predicted rRNA methylase)